MAGHLHGIRIETMLLEFRGINLEEILQSESIKTNALIYFHTNQEFANNLFSMTVGLVSVF